MQYEAMESFLKRQKKQVKLTYNDGFILRGTVVELHKDSILFRTNTCESIIPLSDIKSVVG